MHSILHSPLFPFSSSRQPIPFPHISNPRRFARKKPPRNPISLASITSPSKPTPNPQQQQQPLKQQQRNDDVLASPAKCLLNQALFCFALGVSSLAFFRAPPAAAIAAAPTLSDVVSAKKQDKNAAKKKSHEYADCTEKLLETVSVLLRSVERVRNGDSADMNDVGSALKAVKSKKEEMRIEIMGRLYPQLRVLRREKNVLVKRAGEIIDEILKLKGEYEKLKGKKKKKEEVVVVDEKEKVRMERIEERVGELEEQYNGIWEKVGEVEDMVSRKETAALSYGVREISFIERECEQMVERFKREMKQKDMKRSLTLHGIALIT